MGRPLYVILLFLLLPPFLSAEEPRQIVLTWQNSPQTTMTITWRTDSKGEQSYVRYRDVTNPTDELQSLNARTFTFERTRAWIHTVELDGLIPNREYEVYIFTDEFAADPFLFRTAPDDLRDIVFLVGGDSRTNRNIRREINILAAAQDPDFVMFSGDFIENPLDEQEWDDWFDDWHELMITENGRRIPIIPAIGNHEVRGGFDGTKQDAPFYYNRFMLPGYQSYYSLRYGPLLNIITLDSGHTSPVSGPQKDWLENTLQSSTTIPWTIVHYHVAAFPSRRNMDEPLQRSIREHWVPLFEKYNVDLVCEAHEHAYKRTEPIRDNKIDRENGIIYIGDGGWGAPLRAVKNPDDHWWLAEAASEYHFFKITLSEDGSILRGEPVFYNQQLSQGTEFTLTKETEIVYSRVKTPIQLAPHDGAVNVPPFVPFRFSRFFDTNEYRIQVSRNRSFTDIVLDNIIDDSQYVQLSAFTKGRYHFWRIQSDADGTTENWSNVWSFRIGSDWMIFDTHRSLIPSNTVYSIAAGPNGHPWVGTAGGLSEFQESTLINHDQSNSTLPDNTVRTIYSIENGITWIGTNNGAVRIKTDDWSKFTSETSPLPHDVVTSIAIDNNKTVWFGTQNGAASFDGEGWTVYTTENSGLPDDKVHVVKTDRHGRVWFGTDKGLALFNRNRWQVYDVNGNALPHNRVNDIAFDDKGNVWVGTEAGAAKFADNVWIHYTIDNSGLINNSITAITMDGRRAVWFGTRNGLSSLRDNRWFSFTAENSGLPNSSISSLFNAGPGKIWIGTENGGVAVLDELSLPRMQGFASYAVPDKFKLFQNYPNPFNPETTIAFYLMEPSYAEIIVYNLLGQRVAFLAEDNFEKGITKITWRAAEHPSGIYFYELRTPYGIERKSMILLR